MGAQQGGQRGSRSSSARRQMRDGTGRGHSRSNVERRQMRVETRRNERLSMEPTIPGLPSGEETQGDPRGGCGRIESVAWRRIRDSHWRRTGEWLGDIESSSSSNQRDTDGLKVPRPMPQAVSPDPLWRPWDDSRPNNTRELNETVSELRTSVVGSHKGSVSRSVPFTECPSSNLHHFVRPVPHTSHEIYPSLDIRTKKSIFEGKMIDVFIFFVKIDFSDCCDEERFELASRWVKEVNDLSRQKPGDNFTIISQPDEISGSQCLNCALGGTCLGWNCLQKSGMFHSVF